MYHIEKMNYGYRLTFGGRIEENEIKQWLAESIKNLETADERFGVFVDMRTMKPIAPEVQKFLEQGQKYYKQKGMIRSVVIVSNLSVKMQFMKIARETGIYAWERYIVDSVTSNWEEVGVDWIMRGTDPDKL